MLLNLFAFNFIYLPNSHDFGTVKEFFVLYCVHKGLVRVYMMQLFYQVQTCKGGTLKSFKALIFFFPFTSKKKKYILMIINFDTHESIHAYLHRRVPF